MADAPLFAVMDIDGVLADVRHRLPLLDGKSQDWDGFFAAAPHDPILGEGLELALELAEQYEVVYLTGRPEKSRRDTEHWLDRYGFPSGRLIMRGNVDYRPAKRYKLGELRKLQKDRDVAIFVDDDIRVIQSAIEEGFVVHHAQWMEREDSPESRRRQGVLFDAQETEGRT